MSCIPLEMCRGNRTTLEKVVTQVNVLLSLVRLQSHCSATQGTAAFICTQEQTNACRRWGPGTSSLPPVLHMLSDKSCIFIGTGLVRASWIQTWHTKDCNFSIIMSSTHRFLIEHWTVTTNHTTSCSARCDLCDGSSFNDALTFAVVTHSTTQHKPHYNPTHTHTTATHKHTARSIHVVPIRLALGRNPTS